MYRASCAKPESAFRCTLRGAGAVQLVKTLQGRTCESSVRYRIVQRKAAKGSSVPAGAGMLAAQPPWLAEVRSVDDSTRFGMQECALVSRRQQLVLGDAGCWWSSGNGVCAIFCGKAPI